MNRFLLVQSKLSLKYQQEKSCRLLLKSSSHYCLSKLNMTSTTTTSSPASATAAQATEPKIAETFDRMILFDHQEARDLYAKFKSSTNLNEKREYLNSLIRCLAVHFVGEELNVYPLFEKRLDHGKDIADHSRQEHQQLKDALYQVDKMNMEDPELSSCVDRMIEMFNKHAKEEEENLIPTLRNKLTDDEAIKLGQMFQETKMTAPTHPHPSAPDKGGILESMAGFMAKPIDMLKDAGRSFAQ